VRLAALGELVRRRDSRGDDFAVPERLDKLDGLLRIAGAGRPDPRPDSLLAQAVESDRRDEDWVLKKFACGRIPPGIFRIDHQGVRLPAGPVVVEYVLFRDLEGSLARAALPDGSLLPGLVDFPPHHEIPVEMPLLV